MADSPKRTSIDSEQLISINEISPELEKALEHAIHNVQCWNNGLAEIGAKIDFRAIGEALQAGELAIDEALGAAVPITPATREERWEFLRRFSTDPKGLGLTEAEYWRMDSPEWLDRYEDWRRSRVRTVPVRLKVRPPYRTPDLKSSRERLELVDALTRELAAIKLDLRKFCTGNDLKRRHPDFVLWGHISDEELKEIASGTDFRPKAYASNLVLRRFGITSRETLRKDRRKLRKAQETQPKSPPT
jgi:hypothetical protein